MAKLNLTDVSGGYNLVATYNANNAAIEAAIENTLSRDGTTPNTMSADLDMNSQRIVNVPTVPTNDTDAINSQRLENRLTAVVAGGVAGDFNTAVSWEFTARQEFTNVACRWYNAAKTAWLEISQAGSTGTALYDIDGGTTPKHTFTFDAGVNTVLDLRETRIEAHQPIWLYDSAGDDYCKIEHTGGIVEISSAGGGAGEVPVRFSNSNTGVQVATNLYIATASVLSAVSGYGQLWVGSDSDELVYRDKEGVISGLSKQYIRKSADETVNNSSVYQDDDHFVGLKVESGGRYRLKGRFAMIIGSATPEMRVRLLPSTATLTNHLTTIACYQGGALQDFEQSITSNEILIDVMPAGTVFVEYETEFDVTVAGDSNLKVQWAQRIADAFDTTMKANSSVTLERVG